MQPDPERVAETRSWIEKAADDLRAGTFEMRAEPPLFGDVLFHAQQAVEKVLKAHLVWHDIRFRKTHDLSELGRQCASVEPSLGPVCQQAIELTVYAWIYRYPGNPEPPVREDALQAMQLARRVFDAVLEHVPRETHP